MPDPPSRQRPKGRRQKAAGRESSSGYHVAKQYQRVGRNIDTTTLRNTVGLLRSVDDFLPMAARRCLPRDGRHRELARAIAGVQEQEQCLTAVRSAALVD